MRVLKNILSQLHTFILIALLSTIFWAWIFTFVTDTAPEKKVTVFFDVPAVAEKQLDIELEKDMPDGIKMIRVHTFDYAMFDDGSLQQGDIFIIRRSNMERYAPDLAPLDPIFWNYDGNSYYYRSSEGVILGLMIYDGSSASLVDSNSALLGADFVNFTFPDSEPEDYFLCFGAKSLHYDGNDGAVDTAALWVAFDLLGWHD